MVCVVDVRPWVNGLLTRFVFYLAISSLNGCNACSGNRSRSRVCALGFQIRETPRHRPSILC